MLEAPAVWAQSSTAMLPGVADKAGESAPAVPSPLRLRVPAAPPPAAQLRKLGLSRPPESAWPVQTAAGTLEEQMMEWLRMACVEQPKVAASGARSVP